MSLNNALMIASQSLGTISSQINLVSKNISGAGTEGVAKKTALLTTGLNGASELKGVRRETNIPVLEQMLSANSRLAGSKRISDALDQIDLSLNLSDPAESRTPASLISKLSDSLLNYSVKPDSRSLAELSIQAARDLLTVIREGSNLIKDIRKQSDNNISTGVSNINDILDKISSVNKDIITTNSRDADITDLMDRRDALLSQLSEIIGIRTVLRPNQDIVIYADNGATLFETSPRPVSFLPSADLSAGWIGSPVYIDGIQATGNSASSPLVSGALAGDIKIRDQLAPMYQIQLDEIARGLIVSFAEKDQSGSGKPPLPGLFTTAGTSDIPGPNLISGLSDQIIINPSVDPMQGGDVQLLRDGGMSGDPAYIYNKDLAVGYSERLQELSESISLGQSYDSRSGLDVQASLLDFSQGSIGWISSQRQNVTKETTYQNAIVTQSRITLSNTTGVNIDEQMSQMLTLENAFQASAKVLQTINSVYDALFSAIDR